MDADRVDLRRQEFAANGSQTAAREHVAHAGAGSFDILDHRAFFRSRLQASVVHIGAVGENFIHDAQPRARAGVRLLGQRNREQRERRIDAADRAGDGVRDVGVALGDIGERAMRLHMGDSMSAQNRQRLRRAELIGDRALDLPCAHRQTAPPETCEVRKGDVGADGDSLFLGARKCRRHDVGVAGVEAASDIGARHDLEHGGVVAHAPMAETFPEVGVKIDGARGGSHEKCESPLKRGREIGATALRRQCATLGQSAPYNFLWLQRRDCRPVT